MSTERATEGTAAQEIDVEYYGFLASVTGVRGERVAVEQPATVQDVVDAVVARHPEVARGLRGVATAVDERLEGRDCAVPAGAVVALLPPVSGG